MKTIKSVTFSLSCFLITVLICIPQNSRSQCLSLGLIGAKAVGESKKAKQKSVDFVVSPGVNMQTLQSKKIGVNILGAKTSYGQGTGTTNAGVYADMITKEFLKVGYQARSIYENISETMTKEQLVEMAEKGIGVILIGNMNISTTTSAVSGTFGGGEYYNTGVTGFTLKGIDMATGDILFIASAEYGKAKKAGEVAADIAKIYKDMVIGNQQ